MEKYTDIIIDKLSRSDKLINSISETESQAISASFSTINEYSPELFKNKVSDCQNRIIDKILDINFIKNLCPVNEISDGKLQLIRYNFRHINSHLSIPFINPLKKLRSSAIPILALSGSVIGMLFTAFLFRLFMGNDYRQFGIIVGGAAGSFLLSLLGIYLSKHEILLRFLQGIFGVAIAAEVLTLFTGSVNPVSILWRKLTGRFGNGLWGKLKRIGAFAIGILLLQIAVPETKIPKEHPYS